MPNPQIAGLIGNRIATLPLPDGQIVRMAQFDTSTLAPAMREHIEAEHRKTTSQIGTAIVHLIETEGDTELVARAELQALKVKAAAFDGQKPPTAKVYCTGCGQLLAEFNITNPDRVNTNGARFRNTAGKACTCP